MPLDSVTTPPPGQTTYALGSRQPLNVADLPTPEEAFGVPLLGRREVVKLVFGPA